MGFPRSDEARREDSLQQAFGKAERMNIQRAEKITELERIIVEAKECVKITQFNNDALQEENERLRADLNNYQSEVKEARVGVFGFMIKAEETLRQGMVRNYQEFSDERARLNRQVYLLKEMIIQYQMSKLCWCDKCQAQRNMHEWKEKLERELDALLYVKENQTPSTGISREDIDKNVELALEP